jgi:hypothetical protein
MSATTATAPVQNAPLPQERLSDSVKLARLLAALEDAHVDVLWVDGEPEIYVPER